MRLLSSFLMNTKADLRKHFSALRDNISPNTKKMWDETLCNRLYHSLKGSKVIHTYLPYRSEPDLTAFIQQMMDDGTIIVAPQTLKGGKMKNLILNDIQAIQYGLYQTPYPDGDIVYDGIYDAIIVPGLAFDLKGYRLGYGGGYYDRFLDTQGNTFAPCYPFQLVHRLPQGKYDIPVGEVVLSL